MLTVFVYLLSVHRLTAWSWRPLQRILGWFLIPLGQSALYVYAVHTVLVFYVLQSLDHFQALQGWQLTLALLALMLVLWAMVKRRILFGVIPR
jgi:fucose 4-O-acetylase-like acetyltransferase